MAYKYAKGKVNRGDIYNQDDAQGNTYLDWSEDAIGIVAGGTTVFVASGSTAEVGIGTTDPSSRLHVYGNVSSNYLTLIDNDASSAGHALKVTTDGNGSGTYVLDLEAQSTTLFRVRGDGRVGIGKVTSLPSACLTVSGTTAGDADIAIASKIQHLGDSDTSISFGANEISFEAGGNTNLQVNADEVLVAQYIKHIGDEDTLINFADDKIVLKAGNKAMLTLEEKGSAPHEVTINDGSNNIDFVVKGNGSNQGNPGMKFDADTNKLGINGIGTPAYELEVAGDIGLAEYIYHRGDDDTYIQFSDDEIVLYAGGRGFIKCQEDSTDKLMLNYGGLDIDLQVKGENDANLIRTDAANDLVGIGCTPEFKLHVSGGHDEVAATFVGEVYITGSSSKLVVEETDGSDYRVVIDPNNGPLIHFGNDTANNAYMTFGAFSSKNNIDTETRDFHLYGSTTTTGFYFDESLGRFGLQTAVPTSTWDVSGSVAAKFVSVTGTSNAIGDTHTVLMGADNGVCSVQLPAAANCIGRIYIFKRLSSAACKIQSNGSETIEGSTNDLDLENQYDAYTIQSDGSGWWILGEWYNGGD